MSSTTYTDCEQIIIEHVRAIYCDDTQLYLDLIHVYTYRENEVLLIARLKMAIR